MDKEILKEYEDALIDLDIEHARKLFPLATSDFVLLSALHKARYESVGISVKLRQESRLWLELNNQKRMFGMEFSKDGSLP